MILNSDQPREIEAESVRSYSMLDRSTHFARMYLYLYPLAFLALSFLFDFYLSPSRSRSESRSIM